MAAEAAGAGISNLIIEHLRERNQNSVHPQGFPKSDYWADAADSVTTDVTGGKATVTVQKEGAALHYYGGTVYPKKKALAIPQHPSVADIWPSEYAGTGGDLELIWPKGSTTGRLVDKESGDTLWLLISKATIREDKTVLPTDEQMNEAAAQAIFELITA